MAPLLLPLPEAADLEPPAPLTMLRPVLDQLGGGAVGAGGGGLPFFAGGDFSFGEDCFPFVGGAFSACFPLPLGELSLAGASAAFAATASGEAAGSPALGGQGTRVAAFAGAGALGCSDPVAASAGSVSSDAPADAEASGAFAGSPSERLLVTLRRFTAPADTEPSELDALPSASAVSADVSP